MMRSMGGNRGTSTCGHGGPATSAVAADPFGGLLVADLSDARLRWLAGPQAGPPGAAGTGGADGAAGANGINGAGAPDGLAGPPGPRGVAGQIELVSCRSVLVTVIRRVHGRRRRVKQHRRRCTTQVVSGSAG